MKRKTSTSEEDPLDSVNSKKVSKRKSKKEVEVESDPIPPLPDPKEPTVIMANLQDGRILAIADKSHGGEDIFIPLIKRHVEAISMYEFNILRALDMAPYLPSSHVFYVEFVVI